MAKRRVPPQPFEKWFKPYALEIGLMLRDWNTLQTNLGELFAALMSPDNEKLGFALWNSVPNDRFQRAMIENGAPLALDLDDARERQVLAEIQFILEKANGLGAQRDQYAHTLLVPLIDKPVFVPHDSQGHPPAVRLAGKVVLPDLRLFRLRAIILHEHVDEIRDWLQHRRHGLGRPSLPERPSWPDHPRDAAAKSRRTTRKGLSRPRRSSRA